MPLRHFTIPLLVLLAGCVGGGIETSTAGSPTPSSLPEETVTATSNQTTTHPISEKTMTTSQDKSADLEHRLYDLTQAENPDSFARNHDLNVRGESVRVVIELNQGKNLPPGYDVSVELRQQRFVQGYVPIRKLIPLASHENVSFIRPPQKPETKTES